MSVGSGAGPLRMGASTCGALVRMFATVVVVATAGCVPALFSGTPDACRKAGISTRSWRTHSASGFTIDIPPGFTESRASSIDSEVRSWRRDNDGLSFDYGPYSNSLDAVSLRDIVDVERCTTKIGGLEALVVTGKTDSGAIFLGAHWVVSPGSMGDIKLTTFGRANSESAKQELLAAFWSVEFKGRK